MSQEIWNPYAEPQKNTERNEALAKCPFYDPTKPFLVKDLMEIWLIDIRKTIRPSTYDRYRTYAKKFVLPYVGQMRAEAFDKTALSAMLGLLRMGHSQKEPLNWIFKYKFCCLYIQV